MTIFVKVGVKLVVDIVVLVRPIVLKNWIFLDAHCKYSNTKSTPNDSFGVREKERE